MAAIEHLGDHWNLFVLRALSMVGPQGFNDLASGLSGRISRSVLADRLRKLETLGLVTHANGGPYRLTLAGTGLIPWFVLLRDWAENWLPDDPDVVERDPDVVLGWLARGVRTDDLPDRPVVVAFTTRYGPEHRWWLVLQRGTDPYGCLQDPLLDETRYVHVSAALTTLLGLARGPCDWTVAINDGTVVAPGPPDLVNRVAHWWRTSPLDVGVEVLAAGDAARRLTVSGSPQRSPSD